MIGLRCTIASTTLSVAMNTVIQKTDVPIVSGFALDTSCKKRTRRSTPRTYVSRKLRDATRSVLAVAKDNACVQRNTARTTYSALNPCSQDRMVKRYRNGKTAK